MHEAFAWWRERNEILRWGTYSRANHSRKIFFRAPLRMGEKRIWCFFCKWEIFRQLYGRAPSRNSAPLMGKLENPKECLRAWNMEVKFSVTDTTLQAAELTTMGTRILSLAVVSGMEWRWKAPSQAFRNAKEFIKLECSWMGKEFPQPMTENLLPCGDLRIVFQNLIKCTPEILE